MRVVLYTPTAGRTNKKYPNDTFKALHVSLGSILMSSLKKGHD